MDIVASPRPKHNSKRKNSAPRKPHFKVPTADLLNYPDLGTCQPGHHTTDLFIPSNACYNQRGYFCKNRFCAVHGHHERHRQADKRYSYDWINTDTYSVTLPYDCFCTYAQYLQVRQAFVKTIRKVFGKPPYWFNTEFVWCRPHLHFVFRLPLGSCEQEVGEKVRTAWTNALRPLYDDANRERARMRTLFANDPILPFNPEEIPFTTPRVGCAPVGKTRYDVVHLTMYNLSTNRSSITIPTAKPEGWRNITYTSVGPDDAWDDGIEVVEEHDAETTAETMRRIAQQLGILNEEPPLQHAIQPTLDTYLGPLPTPPTAPLRPNRGAAHRPGMHAVGFRAGFREGFGRRRAWRRDPDKYLIANIRHRPRSKRIHNRLRHARDDTEDASTGGSGHDPVPPPAS